VHPGREPRQQLVAVTHEQGHVQRLLRREVPVEQLLGDASSRGDVLQPRRAIPVGRDQLGGRVLDQSAPFGTREPAAGGWRRHKFTQRQLRV
jgi:hypothetical protein